MDQPDVVYEYRRSGETEWSDGEFESESEAFAMAEERFGDRIIEDCSPRNGQEFTDDIEIGKFVWNEERGEYVEASIQQATVHYEHYHGDLAEHSTYY